MNCEGDLSAFIVWYIKYLHAVVSFSKYFWMSVNLLDVRLLPLCFDL